MEDEKHNAAYRLGLLEGIAAGQEKRLQWLEEQRVRQEERHHKDLEAIRSELSKVAKSQQQRTGGEDARKFIFTTLIATGGVIAGVVGHMVAG